MISWSPRLISDPGRIPKAYRNRGSLDVYLLTVVKIRICGHEVSDGGTTTIVIVADRFCAFPLQSSDLQHTSVYTAAITRWCQITVALYTACAFQNWVTFSMVSGNSGYVVLSSVIDYHPWHHVNMWLLKTLTEQQCNCNLNHFKLSIQIVINRYIVYFSPDCRNTS